jgi:hypothetical protein
MIVTPSHLRRTEMITMAQAEDVVQQYIGVWNDAAARRATIEALWTSDGHHMMGAFDVTGHDALEERVRNSHQRSVVEGGNIFRSANGIQTLPGVVKFRWDMARQQSGEVAAAGVGILILDADSRVVSDYLFTER